eukprot:TRINITY_DN1065_c0_g1_i2.p1 TRINITY_DN1065_c0_g1~~TRINITY_DN1065_c0_g1_i2.p1  ORF type:complete len:114 (+),score=3.74 TRINITY_DN1065_c0_g1_i2:398-739(+)
MLTSPLFPLLARFVITLDSSEYERTCEISRAILTTSLNTAIDVDVAAFSSSRAFCYPSCFVGNMRRLVRFQGVVDVFVQSFSIVRFQGVVYVFVQSFSTPFAGFEILSDRFWH